VSQQENALMAVNEKLTVAQQDNQKLRFQLDDALRHAADELERLDTRQLLSSYLNYVFCFKRKITKVNCIVVVSEAGLLLPAVQ